MCVCVREREKAIALESQSGVCAQICGCWRDFVATKRSDSAAAISDVTWVTLGCHYDWTRRLYHADWVSDMPQEVVDMGCEYAALAGTTMDDTVAMGCTGC